MAGNVGKCICAITIV